MRPTSYSDFNTYSVNNIPRKRHHKPRQSPPKMPNNEEKSKQLHRLVIPLPKFSGSKKEDVQSFLNSFELACAANGIDREKYAVFLQAALFDTAQAWFTDFVNALKAEAKAAKKQDIMLNYDAMKKDLQTTFAFTDSAIAEEKVRNRKQTLEDTPQSYVYDMLSLLYKLDPDMSEQRKIRFLLKDLRPTYLQSMTSTTTNTVKAFLNKLQEIEELQHMMTANKNMLLANASPTNFASFNPQSFPSLPSHQMENPNYHDEYSNSAFRSNNCYRWGISGHVYRDCNQVVFCDFHNSNRHSNLVCRSQNN